MKYKFDTANSYVIVADTNNGLQWMTKSLGSDFELYNSKGDYLAYVGKTACSGSVFYMFTKNQIDSFAVDTSELSLRTIMANVKNYKNEKIKFSQLPKSDYYVITYWSKFSGGKFGYKNGTQSFEDDVKLIDSTKAKVHFLKINVDMQESWGVDPKGKARVKAKVKNRNVTLTIDPLPIKKT